MRAPCTLDTARAAGVKCLAAATIACWCLAAAMAADSLATQPTHPPVAPPRPPVKPGMCTWSDGLAAAVLRNGTCPAPEPPAQPQPEKAVAVIQPSEAPAKPLGPAYHAPVVPYPASPVLGAVILLLLKFIFG